MSGVSESIFRNSGVLGFAGKGVVISLAALLGACSGGVSRFDYPSFANNSGDTGLTTSSLSPVPAESVYQNGAPGNNTAVVRQDLPPPQNQQYAAAEPRQIQAAPLPPAQPAYQAPRPVQTQPVRMQPVASRPPAPPANRTVRVQKGDTLYKIAKRNDVTIEQIRSASNLKKSKLSIGQELTIPGRGAPATSTSTAGMGSYTVKRGDSFSRIARAHSISVQELQSANSDANSNRLSLGQKLNIPGKGSSQSSAPVRVASRGANVPLPAINPARSAPAKKAPSKTAISTTRPQQKVAARTKSLPTPEAMSGNQFRWPVKGRIVAGFGSKPSGKHNQGINVAVPAGTSVKAAENGVVAYAGSELEPYGNLILIRHANNWVTAYAHNDKLMVKRGDTVRRGQIISKAGQSGNVSQPQLHFELRKGSKPVNPLSYMASS
jgi:murein DD-endopeptidase MepM/ murein hydrolase activator NlpD